MRILLVKTSSLGDVIHNLPVVSDLRRALPQAEIDWTVEESYAAIPRLHRSVAAVIPVAVRRWRKALFTASSWREILAYRRVVHAPPGSDLAGYDAVIDSQGLIKSAWLAALARGKKFGFAAPRERLAALAYDIAVEVPGHLHAVTRNRQLAAGALGYRLEGLPLDYGITAPPLRAAWLPRGDYAVLLTATSRPDKEWPEDDWRALGTALIAAGLRCVLPGGSETERGRAARLAQTLGRAVAPPALNLAEMAGLLAGARVVIGVDTGLTHLAVALGRPTVAIFRASDPTLTGVLGTAPHINLGGPGRPPSAADVVAAALELVR